MRGGGSSNAGRSGSISRDGSNGGSIGSGYGSSSRKVVVTLVAVEGGSGSGDVGDSGDGSGSNNGSGKVAVMSAAWQRQRLTSAMWQGQRQGWQGQRRWWRWCSGNIGGGGGGSSCSGKWRW